MPSEAQLKRKRELARLRKAKQRAKRTPAQIKKDSKESVIRKENWLQEPKNRERQRESERKSKAKRKRMFEEAEDWEEFRQGIEADGESGYESD